MRKTITIFSLLVLLIILVLVLQNTSSLSIWLWDLSRGGSWLLPLVGISALLDSVHPCSFSILLITIAFLFGLQLPRRKILQIGGVYIAGIFLAYLFIGLGILKVLHLFNTPHFMGKIGAGLLIGFGILNLLGVAFPKFPLKLKLPSVSHTAMGQLINQTSVVAAFGLGLLVGICQFPCMGGPYLMVIGLLRDQVTYSTGFLYLFFYNLILIVPLALVLWSASDEKVLTKIQTWKKNNVKSFKLWAGITMILLGLLVLLI